MKVFAALILWATAVCSTMAIEAPRAIYTPRNQTLVESSLQEVLAASFRQGNESIKAWIFFTDKGFLTDGEFLANLNGVQMNLTEAARNRRLIARGPENLVDFYDVPVYQNYIDQVLATGVELRRVLRWFNAVTVEASAAQLEQIADLEFVRAFKSISSARYPDDYVKEGGESPDFPVVATTLDYGPSLEQLEQINVTVAHELGFAGQDVLVCMMDTGYRQGHVAFQDAINEGRLIAQHDFINDDDDTDYDPNQDDESQPRHGTLTWSALGGQAPDNLYGPGYLADFCLAKTEDVTSERHIEEDNWAAAAEWADSLGASVISASLGYRYDFTPPDESYTYEDMNGDSTIVTQAADLAAYNGITVVTAQGNDGSLGPGSLIAPADGDSVIACGAVSSNDEITGFSGLGPTYDGRTKPEIDALGSGTACADPNDMNGFTSASGTSLSTPLAGGAAAVLLSAHPNWTPMMVREAMMMTATNTDNPDNEYGWGIIDVGKALYYHPEGDIVIEHEPLVYFPAGLDNNVINATITGGAGINPAAVYLLWRTDDAMQFTQAAMITGDNIHFEGIIPGLDDGYLQYYVYAEDVTGVGATYPYGGPEHYLTVNIDSTAFDDSFENGLYYWKSSGTNGQWAITAERAATGNISVTDSPYRNYNNNAELMLTSNFSIGLETAQSASVSFEARYILQSGQDMTYFEISTDDGQSWETVGSPLTGSRFAFEQTTIDLAEYLGHTVRFRFRLVTNASEARDGIHLDDFSVVWSAPVGVGDSEAPIPYVFNLGQNYPNPFNPSTRIYFSLAKSGQARLNIYDLLGRQVLILIDQVMAPGIHEVTWDGTDSFGNEVASGIYLYKLETVGQVRVKRMLLLR